MIIDTSAWIAILQKEPEAEKLTRVILQSNIRLVSTIAYYEAGIITYARRGTEGQKDLELLIQKFAPEMVAPSREQMDIALKAYQHFGKGQHKAGLNFADCIMYGLAKFRNLPLLFKGNDFSQTDIEVVSY